jgi:hypothetical protein
MYIYLNLNFKVGNYVWSSHKMYLFCYPKASFWKTRVLSLVVIPLFAFFCPKVWDPICWEDIYVSFQPLFVSSDEPTYLAILRKIMALPIQNVTVAVAHWTNLIFAKFGCQTTQFMGCLPLAVSSHFCFWGPKRLLEGTDRSAIWQWLACYLTVLCIDEIVPNLVVILINGPVWSLFSLRNQLYFKSPTNHSIWRIKLNIKDYHVIQWIRLGLTSSDGVFFRKSLIQDCHVIHLNKGF